MPDQADLTEIKIALARIEERQEAGVKAADHRHQNVMQAIATFVPRKEIEASEEAQNERIEALERSHRKAVGLGVTAALGTLGLVFRQKLGLS